MLLSLIVAVVLLSQICYCDNTTKIQIGVKRRGTCSEITKKGDLIEVDYKGMFENGEVFDNNPDDRHFSFTLNTGQAIKGWDQGLLRMCLGEIRKLVIPPDLAYGINGIPPYIPVNSTLIYEIELISISGDTLL